MTSDELIKKRMKELEERNAYEKSKPKGTFTRDEMLKQVSQETGNLISLIASLAPNGTYVEVGTSAGYSSMWIAKGMSQENFPLITHELLDYKIKLARETFRTTGLEDKITLVEGDCRTHLPKYGNIGFCFLDCNNDLYGEVLEIVLPKLVPNGVIVADNVFSKSGNLPNFLAYLRKSPEFNYYELAVGKGVSVCQKKE
jgi:predicted O-methyltransferase YrrM